MADRAARRRPSPTSWAGSVGTSVDAVEFRDEQPDRHEIGNRTFFVADVEPL